MFVLLFLCIAIACAKQCYVVAGQGQQCFDDTGRQYLTARDEELWDELRQSRVVEVDKASESQPSTLLSTLHTQRQMLCKNGRLAYHKMEQLLNEVFAFFLDRVLRLGHVQPATAASFSGLRWKSVRDRKVVREIWKSGDDLVCSVYTPNATKALLPQVFRRESVTVNVPRGIEKGWSDSDKKQVEEWGGVILFDFLIGNTDRLYNSLASDHDGWKPKQQRLKSEISLSRCKHADCHVDNAFRTESGELLLVDNNVAFFYDKTLPLDPVDFMLSDICVFPRRVLDEIAKYRDGAEVLAKMFGVILKYDPDGPQPRPFRGRIFQARFAQLLSHLQQCKERYKTLSFF